MSTYLITTPEAMTAAAANIATVADNVNAAHVTAARRTAAVIPAAADEVSKGIAQVFSAHGVNYQAMAAQATTFSGQFVQQLKSGAFSYASIEDAISSFLQGIGQDIVQVLQPVIGLAFAVAGITLFGGLLLLIALLDIAYGINPTLGTGLAQLLAELLSPLFGLF